MRSSHDIARGLELALRPGVVPVVAVLAQRGELSIHQLQRAAGGEYPEALLVLALRNLAAHGMVQSVAGGSWDLVNAETFVQLTPQGVEFATVVCRLVGFIADQLPRRASLT